MNGRELMLVMGDIDDRYVDEALPPQNALNRRQQGAQFPFRGPGQARVAVYPGATGGIDDALVVEAAPRKKTTKTRSVFRLIWAVPMAACLLLAMVLIGIQQRNGNNDLHGGPEQRSAIYHDLDRALIVCGPVEAKVPAEFWFQIRLALAGAQFNKSGYLMEWDEQTKFSKTDLESQLKMTLREPALPAGDYTTAESVLREARTDRVIAYRVDYIYFDPETMDFLKSFRVFYFDVGHFDADRITSTGSVTLQEGRVRVDELVTPAEAHGKLPHVRSLLFLNNGVGIAVEAQANAVITGEAVNQQKSLELYLQTDRQLVEMIRSLIE